MRQKHHWYIYDDLHNWHCAFCYCKKISFSEHYTKFCIPISGKYLKIIEKDANQRKIFVILHTSEVRR